MKRADVDRPMIPQPDAPTWTIAVDMPVYQGGRSKGKPVGWLTSNDTYTTMNGKRHHARRRRLWREKAYATYELAHLKREFNRVAAGRRVFLTFTYQFVNGVHPDLINLPETEKPIIDALQPPKDYVSGGKAIHEHGIGIIANDNHEWVVVGADQPLLPYLGRGSRIGGRVVVTITPL